MGAAPLSVRLTGPGIDRHVEHELTEELTYSSSMPGGYKSCSFGLARPLSDLPAELYPYTRVIVYDQTSGDVRWSGRLEIPGRGSPSWSMTAVGGAGHATDLNQPIAYVDSRMSEWERVDDLGSNGIPNATLETTGGIGEQPALRTTFPRGLVVPANGSVTVRYPHLANSGQHIARVAIIHAEGLTTGNARQQIIARGLGLALSDEQTWSTGTQTLNAIIGTDIDLEFSNYVDYVTNLFVGGTVDTDVTYSQASLMRVLGTRLTQYGSELITAADYPANSVRPHEVVNDLLGRMLPSYYGDFVSTASALTLDQFAYTDGATADDILSDLMALDPAMRWSAWDPGLDGRWRFAWDTWPTTVGLEADAADGSFTSPGAASDLYNQVRVKWLAAGRGSATRPVWSTYTQPVPLLDQAGVVRVGRVDLGSEVGSSAQAAAAGAAFLTAHAQPTNNGTLTVTGPIVDLEHSRTLQPWEIVAGPLIRVRNVVPRVDALNVTDRDSTTVFRVAEVSYSNSTGTATLTLDSYSDSIVAALGALSRRVNRTART